jgi:murein L,D-transpeptidase YcbB/YkuD
MAAKPNLQQLLESAKGAPQQPRAAKTAKSTVPADAPAELRNGHKPHEVNISGYFEPEVKSALRMVQAKSGMTVKGCLAEALGDLCRKYNVPVPVSLDELRP